MELLLGRNLKFYTSVAKGLELKVRKFWELIPPFVEVTRKKLVGLTFKKEYQLRRFPIVRNCIRQKQPSKSIQKQPYVLFCKAAVPKTFGAFPGKYSL